MTSHSPDPSGEHYRGRFAPTPSGPLHMGSLLTALASFLQARRLGGVWLLRIDDLDRPRCIRGASDTILRQLEAHGLHWDESPRYQSAHLEAYGATLERLQDAGLLYACECTRARLQQDCSIGPDGPVYPGTCRKLGLDQHDRALRLRVAPGQIALEDPWHGAPLQRDRQRDIGDFVVRRRDGQYAYQLACTIDEKAQHITEVVRGADLVGSSFRQCLLMSLLQLTPPRYRHVAVLCDAAGRKLSKQNHAAPVRGESASRNLLACMSHLGLRPPRTLHGAAPQELLDWAVTQWDPLVGPRSPAPYAGAGTGTLA